MPKIKAVINNVKLSEPNPACLRKLQNDFFFPDTDHNYYVMY